LRQSICALPAIALLIVVAVAIFSILGILVFGFLIDLIAPVSGGICYVVAVITGTFVCFSSGTDSKAMSEYRIDGQEKIRISVVT